MNQSQRLSISQLQIKKLQQTINQQFQASPLKKKIQASQIYAQLNQKNHKSSVIMQTSAISPHNYSSKKNIYKQDKKQNKQKSNQKISKPQKPILPQKSQQQKKLQQKQFLINQNKNLKQQTLNLIQQLQTLLSQTKQKKYGINLNDQDQSKQIKLKKAVVTQQVLKITQLQATIAYQKRQLKNVYDDQNVTKQQAQIKILQNQLQKLQKQKKAIQNVLKQQNKGIQLVSMTPQFKQKFNRTKEQLQKIKQEYKAIQNKTLQNQRLLKKKHQKVVGHHAKIKKIQRMLKQKEEKKKKGGLQKIVTLQMMAQVQQQIAELQQQKMASQKSWLTKIANIESQLQTRRLQEQRKILILKDKQKQVRLNDLRIKQLKKLVLSQIGQKRKVSLSGDQSKKQPAQQTAVKGRKRNIKYLEGKDKQQNQQ